MGFLSRRKGALRYETGELLFYREARGAQMIERISQLIKAEAEQVGNTLTIKERGVEISFAAFGEEDEGEAQVYARRELDGVRGYFRQVDAENGDIKRNLLFTLGRCRGIVRVQYSFEQKNERADQERIAAAEGMIGEILKGTGGIITRGGEAVAGADGRIILDGKGKSRVKAYLPPLEEVSPERKKKIPREALERRRRSVMELRRRQIHVPLWLPVIETEKNAAERTARQLCGRAAALLVTALYSECLLGEGMTVKEAREFVGEIVEHFRADEFFSPEERAYLKDSRPGRMARIHFSWQYENLYVMEWALGLFDSLAWPGQICDVGECVRKMREFDSFEELLKAARLREKRELLDAADFIYCLDWACTDARINGLPAPGKAVGEVVTERRRSLFWAAGCGLTRERKEREGEEKTAGKRRRPGTDGSEGWDETDLST